MRYSFDFKLNIMKTNNTTRNTLVIGGKGKTGSRVVHLLQRMGWPVKVGSRSAEIPFNWTDSSTWQPAVQNIHSVYITFQPDLAVPGAPEAISAFTKIAVDNGVQKLVLLSGRGEPEAQACEEIVMNAGIDWTIVRASWFSQNFSESHMLEPILAGYVQLPVGNIGEPFIDADDIADVVVAALTENKHSKQLYEVTGPRLITFKEAIEAIAAATGREIHFEQISIEEYAAMLNMHGVPQDIISLLTYLFTEVLDGRNAYVTDGVEKALGRKATEFSDYVKKVAASGLWNQVPA